MTIVILYVLDSIRVDALEPYGAAPGSSPNLAELAEDGHAFRHAFAQSTWTRPSGASILSSTYPSLHGVNTVADMYPANLPTVAEELRRNGFTTVAITSMGNISPSFGFDTGFDDFRTLYDAESILDRNISVDTDEVGWDRHFDATDIGIANGEDINDEVETVLDQYGEDVFLFIWSIDTHDPYYHRDSTFSNFAGVSADEPLWNYQIERMNGSRQLERLRDIYRDMVLYADNKIGDLVRLLQSRGRYRDCFFVVTGDHGEAFGEHGRNGHRGKPYEEQIHVPLVVKPAESHSAPPNQVATDNVVETIDIYPTICSETDSSIESDFAQGSNLFDAEKPEAAVAEVYRNSAIHRAIRTNSSKYIQTVHRPFELEGVKETVRSILGHVRTSLSRDEVYDLDTDPNERKNLIGDRDASDLRAELQRILEVSQEQNKELKASKVHQIDETVGVQLERLGYLE